MGLGAGRQTVVVTGAAGFIGSHLCDRLLAEGFEVIGLDNLMTGSLENLADAAKDSHFHFSCADVREPLHVYAETIYNLACPASPVHYQADPYATATSSVLGALRLVEHARLRRCRIVHASTSEVYGDPLEHPQRETYWGNVNPIGDRACYDEGKRFAETLLSDAKKQFGAHTRVVRIFNTYGPRMNFSDGRVVSNFINQAISGEPLTLFGSGEQTRSFCYVSDLVDGLFRAGTVATFDGPINLGNPAEFTVRDLGVLISEFAGKKVDFTIRRLPSDDPKRRCPDITRAREQLGFEPKVSLPEGIALTYANFVARINEAKTRNPLSMPPPPGKVD